MGIHILEGREDHRAILFCSVTNWAFGPVMQSIEEAEAFLKYLAPEDPRTIADKDLEAKYSTFRGEMICECDTVRSLECEYCRDGIARTENHRHVWADGGVTHDEECQQDIPPAPGETFRCKQCKRDDARKGKEVQLAKA
jgi:hypothetical protein